MKIKEAISSIQATTDQIVQITEGLSEEVIRWKPAEDVWSVMEILSHLAEAVPYWLQEVGRLVKSPGVEWGRGLQDEARLAAVAEAGQCSVKEVLQDIVNSKQQVQEVLGSVSEDKLNIESPSRNPRFGTKPMAFIVDHLMVGHLEGHLKQIQRNISQYEEGNQSN